MIDNCIVYCDEFEARGMYKDNHGSQGKMILEIRGIDITEEDDDITTHVLNSLNIEQIIDRIGMDELCSADNITETFLKAASGNFREKVVYEILVPLISSCVKMHIDIFDFTGVVPDKEGRFYTYGDVMERLGKNSIEELREIKYKLEEAILKGI